MATVTTDPESLGHDQRIIGLIGAAHFFSHFYHLMLPPLFPVLKVAFGVSYTELGLMMTVFFAVSGIAQPIAGFLVDRFGAHRILWLGLGLLASSIALIGVFATLWSAIVLLVFAGIGNSVFHPSDYAILTHGVRPRRMGRAYGVHTLGGMIGWAAAPTAVLFMSELVGWQNALVILGLVGAVFAVVVASFKTTLDVTPRHVAVKRDRSPATPRVPSLSVFTSAPVLMAFVYFALLAISLTGLQTFLPTALPKLQTMDLATAGVVLTVYLAASAFGTIIGGSLADRFTDHEKIVAGGLAVAAALIFLVGNVGLGDVFIFVALAIAGVFTGATTPSRDMLVRAATPPGAVGKVFGFVYSGLDLGSAVAPMLLGLLLDAGQPTMAMNVVAASLVLTIVSAWVLKLRTVARAERSIAA